MMRTESMVVNVKIQSSFVLKVLQKKYCTYIVYYFKYQTKRTLKVKIYDVLKKEA